MRKIYGPWRTTRGYWVVRIYHPEACINTTMSYAKFLLIEAGIDMTDKEAHHKNEDPNDNSLDNLYAVTTKRHKDLHKRQKTYIDVICSNCLKPFKVTLRIFNNNRKKNYKFRCSKICTGFAPKI